MAVAGCVFNLNRGNFSPITKFIGTVVRARIRTHRDGRPRFKHRDRAPNVDSLSPCATHDEGGNSQVDSKSVQEKYVASRETCYFAKSTKIADIVTVDSIYGFED